LQRAGFASSWIKIITVLLFAVLSLVTIAVVRFIGTQAQRLPIPWLLYFLASGIAYMCVEIGLIAKTELFVGSPLYSVAMVLATFLFSNSIGAYLQQRFAVMRGAKTLILLTLSTIAWGILGVELCNAYLLSIPIVLKFVGVALAVFPAGLCLGMFYPFGVCKLVAGGLRETVPVTYSIATLSSVLGSAWAMTAITNIGFSGVIAFGAVCYFITALIFLAAKRSALR
jgi:hypothetical protein